MPKLVLNFIILKKRGPASRRYRATYFLQLKYGIVPDLSCYCFKILFTAPVFG